MASRNGGDFNKSVAVAVEKARIAAAETERKNQEARAKRDAEARARRAAEERKRRASDAIGQSPSKRPRTSNPPANVSTVLVGIGKSVAKAKSQEPLPAPEPPSLGSFLSQSGALLSSLSSGWSRFTTKLLQKQNPDKSSISIDAPPTQPHATPKATPQVTVDKKLINAFKNYSKPRNRDEFNLYYEACNFLRSNPQNFKEFKKDLEEDLEKDLEKDLKEDLKNINSIIEEGQVKVKAGDILKRAQDVYDLKINSGGIDEYEESKRLKNQNLQKEINIERQKQEEKARKKAERKKAPSIQKWGPPPIQLPPKEERWSENEIKSMQNSADYARLQVEAGTAFSKKGHPGRDEINWIGIFKGEPFTTRVYSSGNPPHHFGNEGIGFNRDPLLDRFPTKPPREDTNASYLRLLQTKFDNNNFDISASVDPSNSRGYIRGRVAEWEKESSQFKIEKTTTNPSNLKDYCEYLMNNIEDLKAKEAKEAEKSGEEIDKSKLKTLIAFQYLELGKIIYAGTWGNTIGELNRSDDSSTQKPEIINKILVTVPDKYKKYLINERNNITHDSISLPPRNPLNSPENKQYRTYLEQLGKSPRIRSTFIEVTREGRVDVPYDKKHKEMLERGEMVNNPLEYLQRNFDGLPNMGIMKTLEVASAPLGKAVSNASAMGAYLLNGAGNFMAWTAQRAGPATIEVSSDQKINTGNVPGYFNPNADARAHDKNLLNRESTKQEFQPNRDTRPESSARRNEASRTERYLTKVQNSNNDLYSEHPTFSFDGGVRRNLLIKEGVGNPFAPGADGRGGR